MKTVKINKITKMPYKGKVYNLELESKEKKDDLFWIEQRTGIVTHNCFPKDLCALIDQIEETGFDPMIMKAGWEQNKKIRPDMDWGQLPGAVKNNKIENQNETS